MHLIGHLAIWSDDGHVMPDSFDFDLALIDLPHEGQGCRAAIEGVARQKPGAAVIFLCPDNRELQALALAHADMHGLNMVGSLPKPLKLERLAALLDEYRPDVPQQEPPPERRLRLVGGQASHVFQSRHDLRSGSVVGYEAFSRIPGVQSTGKWFSGLDHELSLDMTVSAARAAIDLGTRLGNRRNAPTIAFNCPPAVFGDPHFLAKLTTLSDEAALPENTVAIMLSGGGPEALSADGLSSIAADYAAAGFQLHLGAVEMTPASLEQIVHLPLSEVKFDRDFFYNIWASDPLLLDEMLSLCRLRGIASTVARIEIADELKLAQTVGADRGQGYYWSHPAESTRSRP